MAGRPSWWNVVSWSDPITIAKLNTCRGMIPEGSGFYAFSDDPGPLKVNQVLYIGESKNLKNRLPKYLVHDPTRSKTRHKGALFIGDHRTRLSNDHSIYLRWSMLDSEYLLRRDLEAALIQFYNPHYNDRDWDRDHMFAD